MTDEQLREAVARLYEDRCGVRDFWLADAAIALMRPVIRAQALEEAARVAEREGVYPELNCYNGGPEWYKHGKDIAAAIRALKEKPNE